MTPKRGIPLAALEKLMKECGAERVADDARDALREILEERSKEISKKAITYALHAGRKTVKASDIRLASK